MKKPTGKKSVPSRAAGPGVSPGFLLWKVSNAWQRRQRAALQPLGLTHSQFVLLATAAWFSTKETLTQARLAELAGMDVMTTSQVVRALEGAGLVERREHPDDPRAKTILVTPRGREQVQRAVLIVEETDAAFFEVLGSRTSELVRLFSTLSESDAEKS